MKKTRFTESQIIKALKAHDQGRKLQDIARELSIDSSTFITKYMIIFFVDFNFLNFSS